jgi:2-amino-4-hydroxy-6-hydroxymethyldihydropteridine diphosphokinase
MPIVYLSLGSNLGDAEGTIRDAYSELGRSLAEPRLSSLWRSKARYVEDQPDFVNAVVSGRYDRSPLELLALANRIETAFGRDRSREIIKGPRPLDIDIILYGDTILVEPDLVIPHAAMRERKFVLLPLLELDPQLRDPVSGEKYSLVLASLPPQGIYLLHSCDYDQLYL